MTDRTRQNPAATTTRGANRMQPIELDDTDPHRVYSLFADDKLGAEGETVSEWSQRLDQVPSVVPDSQQASIDLDVNRSFNRVGSGRPVRLYSTSSIPYNVARTERGKDSPKRNVAQQRAVIAGATTGNLHTGDNEQDMDADDVPPPNTDAQPSEVLIQVGEFLPHFAIRVMGRWCPWKTSHRMNVAQLRHMVKMTIDFMMINGTFNGSLSQDSLVCNPSINHTEGEVCEKCFTTYEKLFSTILEHRCRHVNELQRQHTPNPNHRLCFTHIQIVQLNKDNGKKDLAFIVQPRSSFAEFEGIFPDELADLKDKKGKGVKMPFSDRDYPIMFFRHQ